MSRLTFLQILQGEVARMQTVHPERTGELARATALIVHGQVLPSADDPAIGQVLSSDLATTYTVNGKCDCSAGAHGKDCRHLHAWKLYRYIQGKMAAQGSQTAQDGTSAAQEGAGTSQASSVSTALPEAPASANFRALLRGFEVQITLRDETEAALLVRLGKLLERNDLRPPPKPAPKTGNG